MATRRLASHPSKYAKDQTKKEHHDLSFVAVPVVADSAAGDLVSVCASCEGIPRQSYLCGFR